MDVLNITYFGIDEIGPEKQLDTIKIISTGGIQYLYNVDQVDMSKPSIKYGDPILLTLKAPTVAFGDCETVYLEFDLFCSAYKGSVHCQAMLNWGDAITETKELRSLDGFGVILVQIVHYDTATTANVEVFLSGNTTATNVYGAVFATTSGSSK